MGAAGSVQSSLPEGTEVNLETDSGSQRSRIPTKDLNEIDPLKLQLDTSSAGSTSSSRGKLMSMKGGKCIQNANIGGESQNDDDDDDRKSVTTSVTRLSSQQYGGGIHSALNTRQPSSDALLSQSFPLPRGGVYVKTKAGAIQFGIPPDTIKDVMTLGLSVPCVYVVPQERFNLDLGINVAEIEFPAYFNFFILQKDVRLLITRDQETDIRKAFEETIEGPADEYLFQDYEYGKFANEEEYYARPDLRKEIDYFKEPRNGRVISCDTLIKFSHFDLKGVADLTELKENCASKPRDSIGSLPEYSLIVEDLSHEERYRVVENGREIASVGYDLASFVPSPEILEKQFKNIILLERELEAQLDQEIYEQEKVSREVEEQKENPDSIGIPEYTSRFSALDDELYYFANAGLFTPPQFGITMLGNSHGFDQSGTTTGFIIWMHGYGVAVDPPPHCDAYLTMNGVSPRLVTSVILTHCHADHDAGTFQKILKERRTTLVTTKTIYQHFLRKYSAVSGLKAEFLTRLLDFKEVNIAEPTFLHGGVFEFFYALHALPCIGFKVTCGGKTMSYSGDTFNDPEGLTILEKRGIISAARKKKLLEFPWNCDVVLHECGVPPIHTPPSTLQKLPDHIKENLYAVHIADQAAEAAGLRKAVAGFENTIVIHNQRRLNDIAVHTLQLCAQTDIFRDADINQCVHLLHMSSRHRYHAGYQFDGTVGGIFFILAEGVMKVERANKDPMFLRLGDYFGEISAMNGNMEPMKLTAVTDVELVDINKFAFNQFLKNCPDTLKRLRMLEAMRSQGFTAALRSNSVFAHLTFPQKTQLQSLSRTPRKIEKGSKLVGIGDVGVYLYLISKGEFLLTADIDLDEASPLSIAPHPVEDERNGSMKRSLISSSTEVLIRSDTERSLAETRSEGNLLGRIRIGKRSSLESRKPKISHLGPGGIYIPNNVFQRVVLGELSDEVLAKQNTALIAQCDSMVFEIHISGFEDFLLRNPGIQLALMKHSSGAVV